MAYVITEACIDIKDKECMISCPVDCIYVGDRMLYINPDQCIDCGSCMPVCPTSAIYDENDLPEDKRVFIEVNRDFFSDITAESCHDIDVSDRDHEYVKNYVKA